VGVLTSAPTGGHATIADTIRGHLAALPPAERRVARALLGGYPLAGLEPLAHVAAQAGASAPTVLRLVGRLGFEGYPQFQRALRAELAARFSSPLDVLPREPVTGLVDTVREAVVAAVTGDLRRLADAPELDAVSALLADPRRSVWTVGGRFSAVLADYLGQHLQVLRPGVQRVPADPGGRHAALLDLGRRAVVVAFDYRRYQHDTVEFGRRAAEQGAALVVFTDHLRSPLAALSDHVVTTTVETGSPFVVMSPAMVAVETLLVTLVERLGGAPRERMERYDLLSTEVDSRPPTLPDAPAEPAPTEKETTRDRCP
jgi:DNA-binding MurR/RpiR family transcriptional regulator